MKITCSDRTFQPLMCDKRICAFFLYQSWLRISAVLPLINYQTSRLEPQLPTLSWQGFQQCGRNEATHFSRIGLLLPGLSVQALLNTTRSNPCHLRDVTFSKHERTHVKNNKTQRFLFSPSHFFAGFGEGDRGGGGGGDDGSCSHHGRSQRQRKTFVVAFAQKSGPHGTSGGNCVVVG